MARKFTGTKGIVKVGSTTICVSQWDLETMVDVVEVTTTCNNGYKDRIGDLKDASGSVQGFWDADQNPHDDPPNINEGETVSLDLYLEYEGSGKFYDIAAALITRVRVTSQVGQAVNYSFDWVNQGQAYTKPTGTWAAEA